MGWAALEQTTQERVDTLTSTIDEVRKMQSGPSNALQGLDEQKAALVAQVGSLEIVPSCSATPWCHPMVSPRAGRRAGAHQAGPRGTLPKP